MSLPRPEQLTFDGRTRLNWLVDEAVESLRLYCPPEGYYLAFSGGKDSQCIYHLAKEAGAKFDVHYNQTGIDPPPVIVALDGTWHRPLTTLELLALQSFLTQIDGQPVVLAGKSDSAWRERIGNAVPPEAAKAMGEQILLALLVASRGEWQLGATPLWVAPEKRALQRSENVG